MIKNLLLENRTLIMGVLNVTSDSLSGDGLMAKGNCIDNALRLADTFVKSGADILDIGGESTRPGADPISAQEEIDRVIPVIEALQAHVSIPLSIDTTKAVVAEEAVKRGAVLINDVSGLMKDPEMVKVVSETNTHVVIMHSQPNNSIEKTDLGGRYLTSHYENVVEEVLKELEQLTLHAISHGIKKDKIIVDVGIGFGKTVEENLQLMNNLQVFTQAGYPLLLGASRKSVIGYTTNAPVDKRLGGSIAASVLGVLKGAKILRVHDVEETVQAAKFTEAVLNSLPTK
ncbi:MAG: dihydropteroate synthase [Alphaproteobacteria bacterium]|nr:dihydropteroate synthase [Alphaproteobacteria bacterium]